MATTIDIPQLGITVDECLITRWVKRKGDSVTAGEVIAEIETDKTSFEITAPADGTLLEVFFEEGALAPVFAKLCVIGDTNEVVDVTQAGGSGRSAKASESGGAGKFDDDPNLRNPLPALPAHPALSPRASRLAAAHQIEPHGISGSGPGGRVLERDVRKALEIASVSPRVSPKPPSAAKADETLTRTRATIARRMRASLAATAQYTLTSSADATGLLALRVRLKASDALHVNIGDLVAFCTVRALLEMPDLNAEFVDGALVRHAHVHLGFACDTPRGLVVPVVRDAHTLTVDALSRRIKELAAQAVQGSIAPEDASGATFTISNLGGLGIETFTPVINPPQVAILGVGAVQPKPVRSHGEVRFIDCINLSLTCDHQVIDGAPGARFLQIIREKIESVELLIER
jgi:pyruvate dehydrogenase E2 component (dihydrolipoamide acetyltransferase)